MSPFTFRFTELSNACIFLIVINLFNEITCMYISFFLEIFKIFSNYCLARGLIDIAYNVSYEWISMSLFQVSRLWLHDRIRAPIVWDSTVSNLVSMAICSLVFSVLTLLFEYGFFYSPRIPDALPFSHVAEDEDVAQAGGQILGKTATFRMLTSDLRSSAGSGCEWGCFWGMKLHGKN